MRKIKFRIWDGNNHKFDYPETIELERGLEYQQFTGLHDRTGKEIYEGDIVKSAWGTGEIFKRLGCWYVEMQRELGYFNNGEVEVIGNIYEEKRGGSEYAVELSYLPPERR